MFSEEYVHEVQSELRDTKRALKAVLLTVGGHIIVPDENVSLADTHELWVEQSPVSRAHTVSVRPK